MAAVMVPFSSAVPPAFPVPVAVSAVASSSFGAQAARLAASPAARPIVPVSRRKLRLLAWCFSAFVIGTQYLSSCAATRSHDIGHLTSGRDYSGSETESTTDRRAAGRPRHPRPGGLPA